LDLLSNLQGDISMYINNELVRSCLDKDTAASIAGLVLGHSGEDGKMNRMEFLSLHAMLMFLAQWSASNHEKVGMDDVVGLVSYSQKFITKEQMPDLVEAWIGQTRINQDCKWERMALDYLMASTEVVKADWEGFCALEKETGAHLVLQSVSRKAAVFQAA
jgi:hypothetical protein